MRPYKTIRALNNGETVEIEGLYFRAAEKQNFNPGDTYIAERNTGPKLLTVKEVNTEHSFIIPEENEYPYDTPECVQVELVEEDL